VHVAAAHARLGYWGIAGVALALTGCPQLLGDDFRSRLEPGIGSSDAGTSQSGSGGAGGGGASGNGEESADASRADGSAGQSCSDGALNQDELAVDCGGVCPACNCEFGAFSQIAQVTGLGSAGDEYGPSLSPDGASLYFSVATGTAEDIFVATRSGKGTVFSAVHALPVVNGSSLDGSPFVTTDDRALLFFSNRAGGTGDRDLWMATRPSRDLDFSEPVPIPGVNSTSLDLLPELSPDGLTLRFESARSGGSGSSDLWIAERSLPSEPFGAPRPLADLNTTGREEGFSLSRDQLTIVFSSNRGGSGMHLWVATRGAVGALFGTPVPISELDSTALELDPALSLDGREIFFVSTRSGDYRIWHASRECLTAN
jgi:Tol biopolymer transport system component